MPGEAADAAQPAISVVVLAYNARRRIDAPLRSLRGQDLREPFEVVVVDSGTDGCAEYVAAAYPEARLVRSARRLLPGAARNAGVAAARGPYVAFLPDDGVPTRDWLRRRLALHRAGYEAVGGSVVNGTPWHPVGTAGYFLEYSAQLPSRPVLEGQAIPHGGSFSRALFERLGPYPEAIETGEDTVFNERCVAAGVRFGFDERAALTHLNLTGLRAYLRHQYVHGRGLVASARERPRPVASAGTPPAERLYRLLVRYPAKRVAGSFGRVARGRPRALPAWLAVAPLVVAGAWAAGLGAWHEARAEAALPVRRVEGD